MAISGQVDPDYLEPSTYDARVAWAEDGLFTKAGKPKLEVKFRVFSEKGECTVTEFFMPEEPSCKWKLNAFVKALGLVDAAGKYSIEDVKSLVGKRLAVKLSLEDDNYAASGKRNRITQFYPATPPALAQDGAGETDPALRDADAQNGIENDDPNCPF